MGVWQAYCILLPPIVRLKYSIIKKIVLSLDLTPLCSNHASPLHPFTVEGLQRADYALSSPPLTTCPGHLASGPTPSPTGFLSGLFKHVAQPCTISLIPSYLTAWQHPSLLNLSPPVTSGFTCLVSSTSLAAPPLSLCCSSSPQGSVLSPHLFSHYALSLGHPSKVHG